MSVLWQEILNESSLAASMREIYDAVSQNKIANLQLDMPQGPAVSHSIQIPVPFYVEDLPDDPDDPNEAATKGLLLTTAHSIAAEEAPENPGYAAKIFTLLLTDEESKIISELESRRGQNPQSANKLLKFVRLNEPTSSYVRVLSPNINPNTNMLILKIRPNETEKRIVDGRCERNFTAFYHLAPGNRGPPATW